MSGRIDISPHLQVMSPKTLTLSEETNVDMQVDAVDQSAKHSGIGNDQAIGTPVPDEGQDLSLCLPSEIAVPEASRERELLGEVSALAEALNFEEQVVFHRTHEVQVDAGNKVRHLLRDQNDTFHRVAAELEERAR